MPFTRPTGGAITLFATGVFGGLATAYLPTQMQQQTGWQADWGPEISGLGLIVVVLSVLLFALSHIKWPRWLRGLRDVRVRLYRRPYAPDEFVLAAQRAVPSSLITVRRRVVLQPYGWSADDPFIRIYYSIFNGSMYQVTFGETVRGEMYVGTALLLDQPSVRGGRGGWPPQATAELVIDQRIKFELWQQLMTSAEESPWQLALKGAMTISVSSEGRITSGTSVSGGGDDPFTLRPG